MNTLLALARSAARLAPLRPSDPRRGIARGTPAFGSEVALAVLFSEALATDVEALAADAAAAALEEPFPALEDAAAEPFPAAAAAAADEPDEELPDPLDALPDPEAPAAAPPVEATAAAAAPEDELEEPELVGVVVEAGVPELEAPDPLAPAPAAPPSVAATAATEEVVLEEELEPSPDPALDAPDPAPAPAAPAPPPATTATEEPVEELLEAAEAIPAENKTANNDNNILFIYILDYYFANAFDQTHSFLSTRLNQEVQYC